MSAYPNQELNSLRKSGQTDAAYRRGQELLKQYPNDKYLKGSYGWVLYDKIKAIVDKAPSEDPIPEGVHRQIRSLFQEYARLGLDRPDLLFSFMIIQLLRLPSLPPFSPHVLRWAGVHSFREEDFESGKAADSGTRYPSLIERLAGAVGKMVVSNSKEYDRSILEFSLELINAALNKAQISDPIWLRYRKGQFLCELGRHELAREHLQYVVKKKHGEFWAWHALAQCERNSSTSTALSLCAKAYLVAGDKKLAVGVLEDVVHLALEFGYSELAKWAVDQNFSLRQKFGWSLPESVTANMSTDWYSDAGELKNPEEILAKHAESSESLLFEGKWYEANFLEIFTNKEGKKILKLVYKTDTSLEVVVPAKRYPDIATLESGTPLYAAIEFGEHRDLVLALKTREGGKLYDCLLKIRGILDHHNIEKSLASVFISPSDFCLLHYSKFKDVRDLEPGSTIVLSCTLFKNRYTPFQVRSGAFQESKWITRKTDVLRVHQNGFGFVGDVYVRPDLVKNSLHETRVIVVALKKPKKKDGSGEMGWQAVSLLSVPTDLE
ncbi:MAG: hypothetical protein OXL40_05525 [Bacteroidota bacterium]|nr:hypothetical protein [Bacteroidota bacterium]